MTMAAPRIVAIWRTELMVIAPAPVQSMAANLTALTNNNCPEISGHSLHLAFENDSHFHTSLER